ncbi:MAG: hypothetical protein U9R07_11910 [Pseudomonadota bacterium]|nr:hypothetical protein [Pseudomonadota bacterium]
MSAYLVLWAVGVLIAMLLQMRVNGLSPLDWVSPKEAVVFVAVALLWPIVAACVLVAMLIDLIGFLIAVARKPH